MLTENVFTDIAFSLQKTIYSDFKVLVNYDSIKQAIETILMTKKGNRTRFQNPYFGSILHKLLFEKMTIFTVIQIQDEIKTSLKVWEPRISVIDVLVNPNYDNNFYNITINYKIIDINIDDYIILELSVLK